MCCRGSAACTARAPRCGARFSRSSPVKLDRAHAPPWKTRSHHARRPQRQRRLHGSSAALLGVLLAATAVFTAKAASYGSDSEAAYYAFYVMELLEWSCYNTVRAVEPKTLWNGCE